MGNYGAARKKKNGRSGLWRRMRNQEGTVAPDRETSLRGHSQSGKQEARRKNSSGAPRGIRSGVEVKKVVKNMPQEPRPRKKNSEGTLAVAGEGCEHVKGFEGECF